MCKLCTDKEKEKKFRRKKIYLINVYNFKNDFNLDLKSSRGAACTISFDKLFQSLITLIKKECLKQLIFEDFKSL